MDGDVVIDSSGGVIFKNKGNGENQLEIVVVVQVAGFFYLYESFLCFNFVEVVGCGFFIIGYKKCCCEKKQSGDF